MTEYKMTQAIERIANATTVIANRSSGSLVRVVMGGGGWVWYWVGAMFTLGIVPSQHLSFWKTLFVIVAWPFVLGHAVAPLVGR
jgi:hypothetical protein